MVKNSFSQFSSTTAPISLKHELERIVRRSSTVSFSYRFFAMGFISGIISTTFSSRERRFSPMSIPMARDITLLHSEKVDCGSVASYGPNIA